MTTLELNTPLAYIETTIPEGMTVSDYVGRRPRRRTRLQRLKRLLAA
jgi:hypothetical protein